MNRERPNENIPKRQRWSVGEYKVSAVTCGPHDGDTVIFLHGVPTSAELWRPMQYYFSQRGYHTLAPDLPGFGKTTCNDPAQASWYNALDMIEQLLTAHPQLKNIWWIGHQAGCLMAAQCAQLFAKRTQRVSLIDPLTHDKALWSNWALSWMPITTQWGIYDQIARARLCPNILQRQHLAAHLANARRLDAYLDRKVLFNEKVNDASRRQEFSNFIKHLPDQIHQHTLKQSLALKCPVQVIMPPQPQINLIKRYWLALRKQKDLSLMSRHDCLAQFAQAKFELVSIASGPLFAPIEKPQEIAETAMLWAQPELRKTYAKEAIARMEKPSPMLKMPKNDGIKIPPTISLPPDIKPEEGPPPLALPQSATQVTAPANQ